MAIDFSPEILRGMGRRHLLKVVYEMSRQAKSDSDCERMQNAIGIVREKGVEIPQPMKLEELEALQVRIERLLHIDVVDNDFLVSTKDLEKSKGQAMPVQVMLENVRSSFNVGSCMRSAEAFHCEQVVFSGYTPTPENSKTFRAALGAEQWLDWRVFQSSLPAIKEKKQQGYQIYAVETSETACSTFDFKVQFPCVVVFGNERYGLSDETLRSVDRVVRIPMFGRKNSLNIAVCAGVVFYEFRRQWEKLCKK